jgi:hypothetical protein
VKNIGISMARSRSLAKTKSKGRVLEKLSYLCKERNYE